MSLNLADFGGLVGILAGKIGGLWVGEAAGAGGALMAFGGWVGIAGLSGLDEAFAGAGDVEGGSGAVKSGAALAGPLAFLIEMAEGEAGAVEVVVLDGELAASESGAAVGGGGTGLVELGVGRGVGADTGGGAADEGWGACGFACVAAGVAFVEEGELDAGWFWGGAVGLVMAAKAWLAVGVGA